MDASVAGIAEEYAEVEALADIDSRLDAALELMQVAADDAARGHLAAAEKGLLAYLGLQSESDSGEEHQRDEFREAVSALGLLREVLAPDGESSATSRLEKARRVSESIRSLRGVADGAVAGARSDAHRIARSTLQFVAIGAAAAVVLSVAVAIWANRSVMSRLRELHRAVAARADSERPARSGDLGDVISGIDELSERLHRDIQEKNRELLRRERVAGIGLLAADVAHELRNPLNAMLGLTELSLRTMEEGPLDDPKRAEIRESLAVVRREALRSREIVERLMAMVRARSRPTPVDAVALLAESVQVACAARPDKAACFRLLRPAQPLRIVAPAQELKQILLTLLINAADAVSEGGRIEVDATASDTEVWLRVRDDGKGFDPARRLERAVPFQTSRSDEGGLGLGLSIAQSLADDIGAEIRCHSDGPGKGSTFVVAVPLQEAST